jgi:hypothetical protein
VLKKLEMHFGEENGDGEMTVAAAQHLGEALGPSSVAHGDGLLLAEEVRRLRAAQSGASFVAVGWVKEAGKAKSVFYFANLGW